MKNKFLFLLLGLMGFAQTGWSESTYSVAKVESAVIDSKTMNLWMALKVSTPCDEVAAPQVIHDKNQPNVIKIEALSRHSESQCIQMLSEKIQSVNLPRLIEMSQIQISRFQQYVIQFSGNNTELIVPGNQLAISIQPQPILE